MAPNIMAESYTNYAPNSSPIWRIDISPINSTIVPIAEQDIQTIGDALEQDPPILHAIENSTVTIPQAIASLYIIANRLKKNELISMLFLQRLASGLSDRVMQERLEEARTMMRDLGIGKVTDATHHTAFLPQHTIPTATAAGIKRKLRK